MKTIKKAKRVARKWLLKWLFKPLISTIFFKLSSS
jgi:hypothetical protein